MKIQTFKKAYTFDDLMLVPRHSKIPSRKAPSTATKLAYFLQIPIVAAPMWTVTESEMVQAMHEIGATAVLHRYLSIEDHVEQFIKVKNCAPWVALGASKDYLERAVELWNQGARLFCVDVANGYTQKCLNAVEMLRSKFANAIIMAGNVCTGEGSARLEAAGANVIRVGIGAGSACITRKVTGFGVPQLTAIDDCVGALKSAETKIVSDGGIRSSGDIVKALAMGANAVMIGGLLAGTSQAPGKIYRDPDTNQLFKFYHGMASEEGRKKYFDEDDAAFVPEGDSHKVWHKGDAIKIVKNLNESLKVGLSFAGAMNIGELQDKAKWVEVTPNGNREGNSNKKMFR